MTNKLNECILVLKVMNYLTNIILFGIKSALIKKKKEFDGKSVMIKNF